VVAADQDLSDVTSRLRLVLADANGKLRVDDAIVLAGFACPSFQRTRLVGRAMRQLGWERCRCRFDGVLAYAYARGSVLEREVVLGVARDEEGQLVVTRREP
jgi:hypothetical protein